MAAWVDVDDSDIVNRWRPLTPAEQATASTLIEDAQDILEEDLEELGYTSAPVPQNQRWERRYKRTIVAMVRRVLTNPEGYLSETIDGYEYRRDKAIATGTLYLSDSELDGFRRRRRGSSFTIRTQ